MSSQALPIGTVWAGPAEARSGIRKAAGRVKTTVDQNDMSALATISTPTEDRSRDVVNPLGIQLKNFSLNPVIFFDHTMSGIYLPIATGRSPDGSIAVFKSKERCDAKSWFSQSFPDSQQIFALIVEGLLNATSVNIIPTVAKIRAQPEDGMYRPGLDIEECELLEWSWVGIPDNPEAVGKSADFVARVLAAGKLCDWPICEPIKKYLLPLAPQTRPTGAGFGEGKKMDPANDPNADEAAKKKAADEEAARKKAADEEEKRRKTRDPDEDDDEEDDEDEEEAVAVENSPSHKHLTAAHKGLTALEERVRKAAAVNEHPKVKSHLQGLSESLAGLTDGVVKCYEKCMGQPMSKDDEDGDGEVDAKSFRKWLADAADSRLRIEGLVFRAKRLDRKGMNAAQNALLDAMIGRLESEVAEAVELAKSAKQNQPPQMTDEEKALLARLDKLEKGTSAAADKLKATIPAGRP